MKKFLLFLSVLFVGLISAKADKIDLTFSELGYANSNDITTVTTGNPAISVVADKGTGSNAPKYYTSGTAARFYKDNLLTISVAEGYEISKVEFSCVNSYPFSGTSKDAEGTEIGTVSNNSWTGNSAKVIFNHTSSTQWRMTKLSVTFDYVAESAVEPVVISATVRDADALVTLSCETEGADIFYGFSPEAMSNAYTAPFSVTDKCTVYAYAKKSEESSITKQLDIFPPYTNFKDVVTKADNAESVLIKGNFEVLYAQGTTNLILTDGTSNILLYQPAEEYAVGTKISEVDATATSYRKLFELSQPILTEGGTGATYIPAEITDLSTINYDDNLLDLIVIKNCTISGKSGNDATIELDGETVALRNTFGVELENGMGYDITGFVWRFDDTLQIVPTLIEGGNYVETVKTPVITPAVHELNPNDLVTITCATAGAKIYYTLDGSEPTQESELYTAPIEFTESCTIMARAYYEEDDKEMLPSEIASRAYHVFDPTCNVIDTDHEEGSGSTYIQHTCIVDGVTYSMIGMHNKDKGIQMSNSTTKDKERIAHILQVTENEGYVVNGIAIDFSDNGKNVTFQVRGANKPFEYPSYAENNFASNGKKIGEISNEHPSIEFDKDYKYFVIYPTLSTTNAVYMNSVTITYREPAPLAAPAVLGIEHLDENDILVDEDENVTYVFTDSSLDIDFDVDLDSDIAVEYVLVGQEEEVAEDAEYTLYDGSSIEITESAKLVYYAINTKTNEKTAPVTFVFDIDDTPVVPAVPDLVEGNYEIDGDYIKSEDIVKISFKTVDGVHIYYNVGTGVEPAEAPALRACEDEHAGYTKHEGEEIELTKAHSTFTFYSCDPATGAHSDVVTYKLDVATGIVSVEAEDGESIFINLQGVKVASPENGIFIRINKGKAEKVMK